MLQLYYKCFEKFCDIKKILETEMNTDLLYLLIVGETLYDCIQPDKRAASEKLRKKDLGSLLRQKQRLIFHPNFVAVPRKITMNQTLDF